jgi:hypothetical protein
VSEDDFEARAGRLDRDGRRALLDDLEAIRSLLDDEAGADAIPVLSEVVEPAARAGAGAGDALVDSGDDGREARRTRADADEEQGDLFDPRAFADRLLDEDWAAERERILDDARAGVDAFSLGLDEHSRREREARLRETVRARLAPRMEQILGEAVDALHRDLLKLLRRELDALVAETFGEAGAGRDQEQEER